jgi:hypothetical protein
MPQLLDAFSIALALFVSAVLYIDFVQGPQKREVTKLKIGAWAAKFVDAPAPLVQKWAVQISRLCLHQATYGRSGVSFWKTFTLSVGLAILLAYLASSGIEPQPQRRPLTSVPTNERSPFTLLFVSLPLHLGYVASATTTMFVLKKVRRASIARSATYLILDAVIAYCIVAALFLGFMLYSAYYEGRDFFGPNGATALKNFSLIVALGPLASGASVLGFQFGERLPPVFAALLVPIIPLLVHPIVLTLLVFIRLTLSWWQQHFADLLYALYESKQGVLTLLAIAVAALGKGFQYILASVFQ